MHERALRRRWFGRERIDALSEAGSAPRADRLPRLLTARVAAVLVRRRSDESPEYRDSVQREQWYVVVPELCWDGSD